ncbi:MAG TPA: SbcC/MukB-like Walker B domain-containing protein, partial [Polyangiales bacterium]|nr:SbcC/MukB-like Walker B domain-containing protein [Polyangiales bacterium]
VNSGPGLDARTELAQLWAAAAQGVEQAERELTAAQHELAAASAALIELRERRRALAARAERWPVLATAAAQAARTLGQPLDDLEQLKAARERLLEESAALLARRRQLQEERDEALRLASDLSGAGAALDPELLRLRDELGADLLIERFDDEPEERAALLQAALGPLAAALVVDDPLTAAQSLAGKPRTAADIWLVRAGVDLELDLEASAGDVVRVERFGVRVTRLPEQPAIGARARSARAASLRELAESSAQSLEECALRARQLSQAQRSLDVLHEAQTIWLLGDPAAALRELEAEEQPLLAAESSGLARLGSAREQLSAARTRLDASRRLEADAHLLDGSDHAQSLALVRTRIERARQGQQILAAVVEPRRVLRELIEALREHSEPASAAPDLAAELARLDGELERRYRALAAADSVLAQRHASGWADAGERLGAQSELLPLLQAQHDEARSAVAQADRQVIEADASWERAAAVAHGDAAEHAAAAAAAARTGEELQALGGAPDDALLADAAAELAASERKSAELSQTSRSLIAELARTRERSERAEQACARARREAELASDALAPARDARLAMQASAQQAGLELRPSADTERSAAALSADADAQRALLIERLARSRGGSEAARELESEADVLAAWSIARAWLLRRVPAQIAGHDDPLRALERLRDDLDVLQERLSRQELDLRGASEDIARGIEVQLRRAATQVRRLNERISGVQFGSIAAIRVQLRRVDRMEQILRALREGEAQELLFLPSVPVEEALEEIFRRYGGGRGGGQRLLDYREYLELAVEIRRQTSEQWELASPTKLSTGEAIGVGAALMMVVLAEWERDANLLRARAASGSLRFLFLDEANRLSRDNLGVLFELCKTLDLQLLIAAPEVARADGNTTYRLVRQVTEDGREEVIVSGRRTIGAALPEESASDAQQVPTA